MTDTRARPPTSDSFPRLPPAVIMPPPPPRTGGVGRKDPAVWGYGLVGVVICVLALALTDDDDIQSLGLFDAAPIWMYIGTALVVSGLVANLAISSRSALRMAWAHLLALITIVHGLPGFVEQHPRFPVAWLHVGFAESIASSGKLYPEVDARFSWPGFFTASAYLQKIAGTDSLMWIVRFAPVLINFLSVILVYELARALGVVKTRSIAAAALFTLANWIGQDYFAPQAIAFLMVFTIVIVVLRCFGKQPAPGRLVNRVVGRASPAVIAMSGPRALAVYVGLLVVSGALVVSHQLSPPMLIGMLVGLWAVGRVSIGRLPWIIMLGFAGWLSYAAESYWLGHLDILTGSVGDVSSVLSSNVGDRSGPTGSEGREAVVRVRMLLTLAMWSLTGLTLVYRRIRGRLDPAFVALFFTPFIPLLLQPYGGEMLLRVALFTLPTASVVIASSWRVEAPTTRTIIAAFVAVATLIPVFVIARFGNESYEAVSDADLELVSDFYDLAEPGAVVYVQNRITLALTERVGDVKFRTLPSNPDDAIVELLEAHASGLPVYVMFSESQARWAEETLGFDTGWLLGYANFLAARPEIRIIAREGDGRLLEVTGDGS